MAGPRPVRDANKVLERRVETVQRTHPMLAAGTARKPGKRSNAVVDDNSYLWLRRGFAGEN